MENDIDLNDKNRLRKFRILQVAVVVVGLLILWGGFLLYLINYGDAVRGNPISFATKKLQIYCTCYSDKLPGSLLFSDTEGIVTYSYAEGKASGKLNYLEDLNMSKIFNNVQK